MATQTIAEALVAAQADMPEIPKDGTATVRGTTKAGKPYEYDYKYATLPTIFRLVMPVLHKHKLALTQTSDAGCLVTTVRHQSGGCIESRLEMPSPRSMSPQDYGKAHSYYRRYEVNGMLGLAPEDDTDADGVGAPDPVPDPAPTPYTKTDEDVRFGVAVETLRARGRKAIMAAENLDDETASAEWDSREKTVLGHEGYESVDEITHRQARLEFYGALEEMVKAIESIVA